MPSSRPEVVLSASDLGAPPLIPMVLQRQDKANLTQYFKSLWSVAADSKNQFLIYVSDVMGGWRKRLDHVLKSLWGFQVVVKVWFKLWHV